MAAANSSEPKDQHHENRTESLKAERVYWDRVWERLAEADGHDRKSAQYGKSGYPSINIEQLKNRVKVEDAKEIETETGMPKYQIRYMVDTLENSDLNKDGMIEEGEWREYINEHRREFLGVRNATNMFGYITFSQTYSCKPPKIFVILVTVIQMLCWIISNYAMDALGITSKMRRNCVQTGEWPDCSFLAYDPYRRREIWRFLTYILLHADNYHIGFNCLIQVVVGIPLEMSQMGWKGSVRVAALYFAGVVMGCLGSSIYNPEQYLVGASAGVYALIFAHLATLVLNWKEDGEIFDARMARHRENEEEMKPPLSMGRLYRALRLAGIFLLLLIDVIKVFYSNYRNVSYMGHAFGGLAGLLVGCILLENRKVEQWEERAKAIAFGIFYALMVSLVLWHVIGTFTNWGFPE